MIASQSPGQCDVHSNRLWSHQQNVKRDSETRDLCVKIIDFIVVYGCIMSCKKKNKIFILLGDLFMRSLNCYFGVYCCAIWGINTKITFSWAHEQFATRVYTLFLILYKKELLSMQIMVWFIILADVYNECVNGLWNLFDWCLPTFKFHISDIIIISRNDVFYMYR